MRNDGVKKILFRIADIAKVTVIYALIFSMLLFAGIYINMRQNSAIKTNMPTEKLRSLEHLKYESSAENEFFRLLPTEYVISGKDGAECCFNNSEIMQTLVDKNKNIIASLCGNNAVYEKKAQAEGKEIWDEAFGNEYFIYIRFANEFPPKIIYDAFAARFKLTSDGGAGEGAESGAVSSWNETADAYIYELIIIPSAQSYYAVARDKNAAVTVIYPPEEASKLYNSNVITAYNIIEGLVSCEFLRGDEEFNGYADSLGIKLSGETVIFKEETFAEVLRTENPLSFDKNGAIDTTVSYIRDLFDYLDFNLEKTAQYLSNGASAHSLAYNGRLMFYPDGLIQYSAQSETEGLSLEKFLGSASVSLGEDYTSSEKLAAAFNFVDNLPRDFIGSRVSLQLTSVSFEEETGTVVYVFSYYLNNILIYGNNNSTDALTIKIKNGTITGIKFYSVLFSAEFDKIKNINQLLLFRQILDGYPSGEGQQTIGSFSLNYFYTGRAVNIFPKWTAVGKN